MPRLALAVGLAGLLHGCVQTDVEKPVAPDLGADRMALATPTAALEADNIAAFVGETEARASATSAPCGYPSALGSFACATPDECIASLQCRAVAVAEQALERLSEATLRPDGGPPPEVPEVIQAVDGYAELRRVCPGVGGTVDVEANGLIRLNVGFTERGLDPVVFGRFERCVIPDEITGVPVSIDGEIAIELAEAPITRATRLKFLVRFAVDVRVGDSVRELRQSLLFDPSVPRLVIASQQDETHAVLFVVEPGVEGFVATDGRYACDFPGRSCTREDGRVLTW